MSFLRLDLFEYLSHTHTHTHRREFTKRKRFRYFESYSNRPGPENASFPVAVFPEAPLVIYYLSLTIRLEGLVVSIDCGRTCRRGSLNRCARRPDRSDLN